MYKTIQTTCLLLLLGSLQACSNPSPQVALHDFGPTPVGQLTDQLASPTTHITVNAPTWLWDNRIRYRLRYQNPSQVRFYGLDRWLAPPPELLEHFLNDRFLGQPYALKLQLLEFEQQFDSLKQAQIILKLAVEAHSNVDNKLVATRIFDLRMASPSADAKGAVAGFTALAEQVCGNLLGWLDELK